MTAALRGRPQISVARTERLISDKTCPQRPAWLKRPGLRVGPSGIVVPPWSRTAAPASSPCARQARGPRVATSRVHYESIVGGAARGAQHRRASQFRRRADAAARRRARRLGCRTPCTRRRERGRTSRGAWARLCGSLAARRLRRRAVVRQERRCAGRCGAPPRLGRSTNERPRLVCRKPCTNQRPSTVALAATRNRPRRRRGQPRTRGGALWRRRRCSAASSTPRAAPGAASVRAPWRLPRGRAVRYRTLPCSALPSRRVADGRVPKECRQGRGSVGSLGGSAQQPAP